MVIVIGRVPQPFWLCELAGGGGGDGFTWMAGKRAQLHLHERWTRVAGARVNGARARLPLAQVGTCLPTVSPAQFWIAQSPVVGHCPGTGDPWSKRPDTRQGWPIWKNKKIIAFFHLSVKGAFISRGMLLAQLFHNHHIHILTFSQLKHPYLLQLTIFN